VSDAEAPGPPDRRIEVNDSGTGAETAVVVPTPGVVFAAPAGSVSLGTGNLMSTANLTAAATVVRSPMHIARDLLEEVLAGLDESDRRALFGLASDLSREISDNLSDEEIVRQLFLRRERLEELVAPLSEAILPGQLEVVVNSIVEAGLSYRTAGIVPDPPSEMTANDAQDRAAVAVYLMGVALGSLMVYAVAATMSSTDLLIALFVYFGVMVQLYDRLGGRG
jgi:hypothetical protein